MEPEDPSSPASDAAGSLGRTFARVRLAFGASTLLMLALSWPLWVNTHEFPRVPFVRGLPELPGPVSWALFVLLGASISAAAAGVAWRAALGLSLALFVVLIAQDQARLQPWVYQYLLTGLALATVPRVRALGLARLFIIAMYAHSGLSKLDVSFCRELGNTFLETAAHPFELEPSHWPAALRTGAILAMPATELLIALGLCVSRTRRVALWGAVGLHAALIGILGPWGLGHSTIVLVWNGALIVEDLLLFGSIEPESADEPVSESRLGGITSLAFMAAALLPFGARRGLWDAWPSFALYASHTERTDVLVHADDLAILPRAVQQNALSDGTDAWRRLDLTNWSRAVRGVPVYPQSRTRNGLAEALAVRLAGRHPVGVVHWGRADRWTGTRSRVECWGLDAIRRQGERYHLNAHPAQWHAPEGGNRAADTP